MRVVDMTLIRFGWNMRSITILASAVAVASLAGDATLHAQDLPFTLTLRQAVDMALRQSPALEIATLEAAAARFELDRTKSATLPQVTLQASEFRQTINLEGFGVTIPGVPDFIGPFEQFDLRPSVTQSLVNVELRHQIEAARGRAAEQAWTAQASREEVVLGVIQGYLQVLESQAALGNARARVQTATAMLTQARQYLTAGTASRLDEQRAIVRLEAERRVVTELTAQREVRQVMLAARLGLDPVRPIALTDGLAPPSAQARTVAVTTAAIADRPELKAMRAQVGVSLAESLSARAERLPTVDLAADVGLFGSSPLTNRSTYRVGVSVRVPIWLGGRTDANIQSATTRLRQAEETMRETQLRIVADVRVASIEMAAAADMHAAAAAAVEASRGTVGLALARFGGGLSTNIDVVFAQETLANAEFDEIRSRYAFQLARAKLARARGDVMSFFTDTTSIESAAQERQTSAAAGSSPD
jgi:outer membrane protein